MIEIPRRKRRHCAFRFHWLTDFDFKGFRSFGFNTLKHPSFSHYKCNQMVRLFFNIWPFVAMKISQKCHKFAQGGSAFCQIRKKRSNICQTLVNFCKSGKIYQMWSHCSLHKEKAEHNIITCCCWCWLKNFLQN